MKHVETDRQIGGTGTASLVCVHFVRFGQRTYTSKNKNKQDMKK